MWSNCRWISVKYPDVSNLNGEIGTTGKLAHIHHTGGDAHEEYTFFLILCVELSYDHVQCRLGGSIQSAYLNLQTVDKVEVGMTGGNGDDLLDLALFDERDEVVEEVDVADAVRLESRGCNLFQLIGVVAPV